MFSTFQGLTVAPQPPFLVMGMQKKPFCRRLVNHFMDVLKQKIIGLCCTDLVLVPILQGAIPYTYSKAEIQWVFASIKERVLIYAALFSLFLQTSSPILTIFQQGGKGYIEGFF